MLELGHGRSRGVVAAEPAAHGVAELVPIAGGFILGVEVEPQAFLAELGDNSVGRVLDALLMLLSRFFQLGLALRTAAKR